MKQKWPFSILQFLDYCFVNNPCSENGECINGVNEASCVCNPGFVGNLCQCE